MIELDVSKITEIFVSFCWTYISVLVLNSQYPYIITMWFRIKAKLLNGIGKWNRPWTKSEEKLFYFCPRCGSTDITWIGGLPILAPHMECKNCGQRGVFILGNKEMIQTIRKDYLEGKRDVHEDEPDEEEKWFVSNHWRLQLILKLLRLDSSENSV